MEDWAIVNDYRHHCGIVSLYPNTTSCRLIFIDDNTNAYIYNPINDQTLIVPDVPSVAAHVIWETSQTDKDIFVIHDNDNIYTYVHLIETIEGMYVIRHVLRCASTWS